MPHHEDRDIAVIRAVIVVLAFLAVNAVVIALMGGVG